MNDQARQERAKEIMESLKKGSVEVEGALHELNLSGIERIKIIRPKEKTIPTTVPIVELWDMTSTDAIWKLHDEMVTRIGVLNFASCTRPGGGFLSGSLAQEEDLARSGGLYHFLTHPLAADFYTGDELGGNDEVLITTGVPFWKDRDQTREPIEVSVISGAAPNLTASTRSDPSDPDLQKWGARKIGERTSTVLRASAIAGVRTLILGAWGCGVFRNDPLMTAREIAMNLTGASLLSPMLERIVFAIPDRSGHNHRAFKRALEEANLT